MDTKFRQEAELRMKKDILEKMANAQIDIANLAIEKWEETERLKYVGEEAGKDSGKLLSEERIAEHEIVVPSVSDSTIS